MIIKVCILKIQICKNNNKYLNIKCKIIVTVIIMLLCHSNIIKTIQAIQTNKTLLINC